MTPKAIKKALSSLQKPISESSETTKTVVLAHAYEQAMLRINGQQAGFKDLAHKVLLWIVCAERELTATELQDALAVEIGELELDEENLPSIRDMVSVCAGLVTVDYESNVIRLVHYTTQEYFNQTRKRWFPDADVVMADTCASYLMFEDFKRGACLTEGQLQERLELYPLYNYAAHNWGHHARKVGKLCDRVMEFLECDWKVSASIQALRSDFYDKAELDKKPGLYATSLHLAAWFGIVETVEALVNKFGINRTDEFGTTALSCSVHCGHGAVVKLLLAVPNIDLNSRDNNGMSPLCRGAYNDYGAIVKLLLAVGADPNFSFDSETPIFIAAKMGHEAIVEMLLAMPGIDIHINHDAPLYRAVAGRHVAVVELLLAAGANPNLWNGTTLLERAADNGDISCVEVLLAAGADPNPGGGQYGSGALWVAVDRGHDAVVKLLLAAGAEMTWPKARRVMTELHMAARAGHEVIVKALFAAGAGPDVWDTGGQTPLLLAIEEGYKRVVEILLAAGADPDLSDLKGQTPLHLAAYKGHEAIAERLLAAGANPNLTDSKYLTPLAMAQVRGHEAVVKLLSKGAKVDLVDEGNEVKSLVTVESMRKRKFEDSEEEE